MASHTPPLSIEAFLPADMMTDVARVCRVSRVVLVRDEIIQYWLETHVVNQLKLEASPTIGAFYQGISAPRFRRGVQRELFHKLPKQSRNRLIRTAKVSRQMVCCTDIWRDSLRSCLGKRAGTVEKKR